MLGGDAGGGAVRAAEHHRRFHLAAGHVERLRRRVEDLVDRLHGEVEGHELDDRLEAGERGADAEACEAVLGDRRIDHALRTELLQQALRDLVGALILGDLLAHHEDVLVAAHLLGHGVAQRFAHGDGDHLGAFRDFRKLDGVGFGQRRSLCLRRFDRVGLLDARFGFLDVLTCRRIGRLRPARRGALDVGGLLALAQDHRDRRVDRNVRGAFRNQNLAERALVDRFDLHGRFVGLDLGDDVAGLDRVALVLEPLGEVALLHCGRQRGHQHFNGHGRKTFYALCLSMILSDLPSPAEASSQMIARARASRRRETGVHFSGSCSARQA